MKKNITQKGITLIALLITIVVLLFLTITVVSNTEIISHSDNAAETYKNKQVEENIVINNWLDKIVE